MFKEWRGEVNLADVHKLRIIDSKCLTYCYGRPVIDRKTPLIDTKLLPGMCKMELKTLPPTYGPAWEYIVTADIPGIDPALLQTLTKKTKTKWTLLVTDHNGYSYVLGPAARLAYTASLNTENKTGAITWTGKTERVWVTEKGWDMNKSAIDLRDYENRPILIYRGDSLKLDLEWPDENGEPESLTGSTFNCEVYNQTGQNIMEFTMADGFTLTDDDKKLVMSKTPVQTAAYPVGEFLYELKHTKPTGEVKTRLVGVFVIEGRNG